MNPSQDPLLEEMIREQSEMIENLKKQVDGFSENITKKDEIIKKQEIQIRKDYTNSSLPSSSDPNHKPIRNGKVNSGRKKGGQKNHKGHKRKEAASDTIITLDQEPEQVRENPNDYILLPEIRSRKMVSLRLVREVTEYKAFVWKNVKTGRKVSAEFLANCVNEINYDESVKAFLLILTCYMNVSIRKAQDFLYSISEGTLDVSTGSICNLRAEFERKSKEERDQIWNCLHNSKVMGSDTTFTRVKGTTAYFGVHQNKEAVYYTAGEKKGLELVKSSPLEGYEGISVHDGEAAYFRHGNLHQQCIVHLFRYLRLIEEFEPHLTWSKRMHNLLQSITQETEKRKKEMDPADLEKPVFTDEKLERIRSAYNEILEAPTESIP